MAMVIRSGALLWLRLVTAFLAEGDSPEIADEADKRAALGAWISFGSALLPTAGPANHRVVFLKFGHVVAQDVML
jgi:hypothetical protein